MVACVAFEGHYQETREFAGKEYQQMVYDIVVATQHGVAHFKCCQNLRNKQVRVFTDHDPQPPARFNSMSAKERLEWIKGHKFFFLSRKNITAKGGTFTGVPFPDTETLWEGNRALKPVISPDEKAMRVWKMMVGDVGNVPTYNDIMVHAEKIVADERDIYLRKKAVAMAEIDPDWGMF